MDSSIWPAFQTLNARRRAVRHFRNEAVADQELEAIILEAQLAPSSNNSQPYMFICVRSPKAKAEVARYCRDQSAAASAPVLIVLVCGIRYAKQTLDCFEAHLAEDCRDATSIGYHRRKVKNARWFLIIGSWVVWTPVAALVRLLVSGASLLPLGRLGLKHWSVRSSLFAAQNLMTAASAAGLDSCPMEGFNAAGLARHLKLARDCVIPVVIAIGHRAEGARVDERWRKPLSLTAKFI